MRRFLCPVLLVTLCLMLLASQRANADSTDTIAFQGRVLGSGGTPVPNAVYRMSFTLFDAATDGASLWTETNFNVPVAEGLFAVQLGSITPFPEGLFADEPDLHLEIAVDVNNNALDAGDIQSPRTPLNAVPVALHAKNADTLGGLPMQDFASEAEVSAAQALQDAAISTLESTVNSQDNLINGKLASQGEAYLVVTATSNPASNGTNLITAYNTVKALTPHGAALSADNRVTLLVPPGVYDLGSQALVLDTEFVDLVGMSSAREDQFIQGTSAGPGTGVIQQTANDVKIENLRVRCTLAVGEQAYNDTDPAAYFPESGLAATRLRNCVFEAASSFALSMRRNVSYSGTYTDCIGGIYAFGCQASANGTFVNCTGGDQAFGGYFGTASGTFINCTGGIDSFGGYAGSASGQFRDCKSGTGGYGGGGGSASGVFVDCSGGDFCFGYGNTSSGTFTNCTAGEFSFGSGTNGVASGVYLNCTAGAYSFGGYDNANNTNARLFGCRMTGTNWNATFRGRMENCNWSKGFTAGAEARIYGATILGNVNLNSTAAGIAHSRVKGTIQNAGSASFNVGNVEDVDVN